MSEVDLAAVAAAHAKEEKAPLPLQEVSKVLKACGFGRFHLRLLITSFFGVLTSVIVSNLSPYILPNAECDLRMNLVQKGLLNGMPFIGMIISSVLAGFLTDTFGRKIFLIGGYASLFLMNVVTALSQTYVWMLTAKFIEGILFAAAFSPTMTYTSECCHNGIRDRVMLIQSSFQSVGQIVLAGLTWLILMQDWYYSLFGGRIVLNTWNFYLLIMSASSLVSCILYMFLPESPKYLLSQRRYSEARATLLKIYQENTGKSEDSFPYKNIWRDKQAETQETDKLPENMTLKHQLVVGLYNIKPLFHRPLLPYLLLFCFIMFNSMYLYNTIRLWFPQLSTIVEHYSTEDDGSPDLCMMLDAYTRDFKIKNNNVTIDGVCVPTKSGAVTYINSIILGLICVPIYVLNASLVNKVGKKRLFIITGLLATSVTLSLRWSKSKIGVVALFGFDLAVSQSLMSFMQAIVVEVFPTTTRTLAVSMTMMSGRIGTLTGNVMFPILLDLGCVVPFFTLTGLMICVTTLSFFLPNKKQT